MAAWGLVNPSKPSGPHPTAVVVDADGVVRYFRQDVDYTKRPDSADLLTSIDAL